MSEDATVERLLAAVKQRRERVNDAIVEELPIEEPERLYEASRYLLDAGGKRLRPTVCLLVGEALTDVEPGSADYRAFPALFDGEVDLMRAAVGIEVIQSFTLIHDDIMDDDDLRRGVPAVHREYDESTAILAGDTLYAKAFEFMTDTGSRPELSVAATNRLARTCTEICEGQALDVEFENRSGVLPDEYLEMIELKTAVLYGASAAIPAILLGAGDDTVEALRQYGIDSGRAFQIQDDLLDLTVSSEELGKQRGSDLVGEKETLITLHARQQGVDVDSLVDAESADELTEAEVADAVDRLEDAGSIEYARSKAQELTDRSKGHLDALPENEARRLLADLADYLINRGY
ncbi:polyprenyl synthetase family protein [Halolamina sp. CBA1230]|uniref:geranylfarnesyl diphosphate synthase n=1 Tax=Halolamina sp. CBA1230 TaxID=1853690 RepID=UPI0009A1E43E|nr:polyprenyl synthetase family protein [Halolamina sp. CBA1230]QKY19833.1 polyprenyl synthetase family protein [Halolamina sp. CBA1230]